MTTSAEILRFSRTVEFDRGYFRTTEFEVRRGGRVYQRRTFRDADGEIVGGWRRTALTLATTRERETFERDMRETGFEAAS